MCSIVGSFKKDKVIELCKLNEYRGCISHSICYYDIDQPGLFYVCKSYGPLDYTKLDEEPGMYIIVHQQAPTSDTRRDEFIHPAQLPSDWALWHNGILKQHEIERLQKEYDDDCPWDTGLLLLDVWLNYMKLHQIKPSSNIDGSFSCLLSDLQELYLFRNEIAPMFIDDEMTISSTAFEGSRSTEPNKTFAMNFKEKKLEEIANFQTFYNPYAFLEDEE